MITHHRTIAATVAGAAALTLGLSATGGAQAAGHHHRLTVVSHELSSTQIGGKKLVESDRLTRSGTRIGYTANTCTFDFTTHSALCLVSVALSGGQLRARATVDGATNTFKGRIVGGSGAYRGAHGTVVGRPGGSHPADQRIVLDWTD